MTAIYLFGIRIRTNSQGIVINTNVSKERKNHNSHWALNIYFVIKSQDRNGNNKVYVRFHNVFKAVGIVYPSFLQNK